MAGHSNKRVKKLSSTELPIAQDVEDRLSFLPHDIQRHIVSSLLTHDAVKISILSRMWRKLWYSLPNLLFAYPYFPDMENKLGHFIAFVDQTLALHDTSDIYALGLYLLPLDECYINIKTEWLTFAIQHNVQKLIIYGKAYELPDCLFTCKSLVILDLALLNLDFQWPELIALPKLRQLILKGVRLYEDTFYQDLSSVLPALDLLSIVLCDLTHMKFLKISASKIKFLTIWNCPGIGNCAVKLNTPSLEDFTYMDDIALDYDITSMPFISVARVWFLEPDPEERSDDDVSRCTTKVLGKLWKANHLCLHLWVNEFLSRARDLRRQLSAISLCNLKTLRLGVWPVKQHVRMAMLLLSRCPNLWGLSISFCRPAGWTAEMPNLEINLENWASQKILNHLACTRIQRFEGSESEFELVKFLLGNAHALVQLQFYVQCEGNRTGNKKYLGLTDEAKMKICAFKRASSAAMILFVNESSAQQEILEVF